MRDYPISTSSAYQLYFRCSCNIFPKDSAYTNQNIPLMLTEMLAGFFERDIKLFRNEINLFTNEDNLWKTTGTVQNSAGNLALHIIGGTNYLIGAVLAKTSYVRDRDAEFALKNITGEVLLAQLDELTSIVVRTIHSLNDEKLAERYPVFFDKPGVTISYVLIQLLAHLNYHLGQVNYLRRILE